MFCRGGGCFSHCASSSNASHVVGTGFGYLIACFLFLIINCIVIVLIRSDVTTHFGSESTADQYVSADAGANNATDAANYQYQSSAVYADFNNNTPQHTYDDNNNHTSL